MVYKLWDYWEKNDKADIDMADNEIAEYKQN